MDEKSVISVVERLMPSVVSIVISKHLEDVERDMPADMIPVIPGHKATGKKPGVPEEFVDVNGMVQVGGGSGFIVDEHGLILTNKHVIAEPKAEYTIILNDGTRHSATVVSRDPINDVAILKVDANNLPTVTLGEAHKLKLGSSVIAIGNALGIFKNTVSVGIVSGLSRSVTAQADPQSPPQELRGLIQTDAAINPGNSGGPLVDSLGRVIGINAAIITGAQNIGLAIPINAASRDLSDLKKFGRIRRPFFGVRYVILDDKLQKKLGTPENYGAIVVPESPHDLPIIPGSPAELAGIKEKDILLEFNNQKITGENTIQDYLEDCNVGDVIQATILRGNERLKLNVKLTERL